MARLVSYYDLGSMTTETGATIINYLPYWILKTMNASFPADSVRLDAAGS
jgi:hypothetical protein